MKIKLSALLFFCFIFWVIAQANTGGDNIFFRVVGTLHYGDKIGHFFLYGVLTLLANFALQHKAIKLLNRRLQVGAICVAVFSISEELSQLLLINRSADMVDLVCSLLGIIVFSRVGGWFMKKT